MKRILFIVLFWFFYTGVFAQTGNKPAVSPVEQKKFSAGISFSPYFLLISYTPGYNPSKEIILPFGFYVLPSINAEYSINKRLSVQSGLNYIKEGSGDLYDGPKGTKHFHMIIRSYRAEYFGIPLNLKIFFKNDPKRKPYIAVRITTGFINLEKIDYGGGRSESFNNRFRFNRLTPTFAVGKERISKSGRFSFIYSGVCVFPPIYNRKNTVENFTNLKVGMELGMNYRF